MGLKMTSDKDFCMNCQHLHGVGAWFKTKDHYLKSEYPQFVNECEKQGFKVKEKDYKEMELTDSKGIKYKVFKHECGPEIISLIADSLGIIAGLYTLIQIFKKLTEKKAKRDKEKPAYTIYVFNGFNKVTINNLSKEAFAKAFKPKNR